VKVLAAYRHLDFGMWCVALRLPGAGRDESLVLRLRNTGPGQGIVVDRTRRGGMGDWQSEVEAFRKDFPEAEPFNFTLPAVEAPAEPPADEKTAPAKPAADAPAKKPTVLLVTPDNYFLAKAVSSLPGVDAKLIGIEQYPIKPEPQYDVIIYDRVMPQKYPSRGNFICIGGMPPRGLALKGVVDPDEDKLPEGERRPRRVDQVTMDHWEKDHPILRGLDLNKLFIESASRVAPGEGSAVLAWGRGDPAVPLVVLHREAGRTFLVLPFNVMDSNWPLKVSFPVFLQQAVDYLASPHQG